MKSIRNWLEEDAGITLSSGSLTSYISRIRRRSTAQHNTAEATGRVIAPQGKLAPHVNLEMTTLAAGQALEQDPMAQAKRVLSQPKLDIRKLHNDGDPEGRNLI